MRRSVGPTSSLLRWKVRRSKGRRKERLGGERSDRGGLRFATPPPAPVFLTFV